VSSTVRRLPSARARSTASRGRTYQDGYVTVKVHKKRRGSSTHRVCGALEPAGVLLGERGYGLVDQVGDRGGLRGQRGVAGVELDRALRVYALGHPALAVRVDHPVGR
jgi:hypothetical protein